MAILVTSLEGHCDTWQDQHTSDSALFSIQDMKLHLRGGLKDILSRLSVKPLSQSPSGFAGTVCMAVHKCSRGKESKTLKETWLLLMLQAIRHLGCFRNVFSSFFQGSSPPSSGASTILLCLWTPDQNWDLWVKKASESPLSPHPQRAFCHLGIEHRVRFPKRL